MTVVAATWIGGNALRLTYRTDAGKLDERLLYRDHEPRLDLAKQGAPTTSPPTARQFKLAAEALRIRMAGRFDPMLAVHTSDLEPLPHQIQAVYGELIGGRRCGSCSPTTPARARRSWRACTSRS